MLRSSGCGLALALVTACGGPEASAVRTGMTGAEVRAVLGTASTLFELAEYKVFSPNTAACRGKAPVRVMVYKRRFRDALLVYLGSEDRVECVEESMVIDIRSP